MEKFKKKLKTYEDNLWKNIQKKANQFHMGVRSPLKDTLTIEQIKSPLKGLKELFEKLNRVWKKQDSIKHK